MSQNDRSISGYLYENEDNYEEAKKELEAVNYIKEQMDMEQPQMVLHAFQQILHQDLFHTQVGYSFLREMQNLLYAIPEISNESIPDIPVKYQKVTEEKHHSKEHKKSKKQAKIQNENKKSINERQYKKYFRIMLLVCFVLVVIIIGMFAVTMTSDSPTIVNYREKIVDEYATWEEQLDQREADVKARELKLQQQEQKINITQDDTPTDE